ncbi:hypothetical protein SUGI_0219310 [Cryptomeria japonica]|nr:hypothetical protein SUGI_0219310 [Cryptomeria japonica]
MRPLCTKLLTRQFKMAATAAATSAIGFVPLGAAPLKSRCSRLNCSKVQCLRTSMAYAGFEPDNKLMKMGLASTANEKFAYNAFKGSNCDNRRPRTLGISYGVGAEIARIVPIMSGLVLMGIAIGFVLLRIEASVEESQE